MIALGPLSLTYHVMRMPLASPFHISGMVFTTADTFAVSISNGIRTGRGEALGVYYLNDDVDAMARAAESARVTIERGITREELRAFMPACGARNAIDAALWELEARETGRPVWEIAGLPEPRRVLTTFTLSIEEPDVMARRAGAPPFDRAHRLKIKLAGALDRDLESVAAVRKARPGCWIGVDANQGYCIETLPALMDGLLRLGVQLVEQPLRRGREADLDGFLSPIPLAADESVLTLSDLDSLVGRFEVVNIKLDKCGGLTEAIAMAKAARELGLRVMVGNMVGSSLAMAPAFILAQICDLVDLDGPIFLAKDSTPSVVYEGATAWCPENVWGRGGHILSNTAKELGTVA